MTWWQKKPFIDAITAYEKISAREQKIVLSTFVVVLSLLGYMLMIEPLLLSSVQLVEDESKLVKTNTLLSEQIEKTKNRKTNNPNLALETQLKKLLEESQDSQKKIDLLTQSLVAPKQMVGLLEKVLTQDKQLKLISLSNLPEEAMSIEGRNLTDTLDTPENEVKKIEALIYRHTFEIELEATYDSAVSYLKRLDSLPWQLFWQDLKYESTVYPKGRLSLRVYTLSMSQEVLGV
jgi:MSHA biogenesis protein MshJ